MGFCETFCQHGYCPDPDGCPDKEDCSDRGKEQEASVSVIFMHLTIAILRCLLMGQIQYGTELLETAEKFLNNKKI